MNVCCRCFCSYVLWTVLCVMYLKWSSFSRLMNLALSQFLNSFFFSFFATFNYLINLAHCRLRCVSLANTRTPIHVLISSTTASKQRRSPCCCCFVFFREWLEKPDAFGGTPNRLSRFSLFCFDRKWCKPSPFEFLMFVLAVRALKMGQRCKTLHRKKKKPLEKSHRDIKCGPGTWNVLPPASESVCI